MKIINQNPYRQLGVYASSSKKEQLANEGKIKAFLKIKKQVAFPFDLNQYLPKVERSAESVADAMSKLTLPKDQMRYAQFWFINVTPLDKIAFNHLTSGNMDVAIQTWKKKDCASSLQNRIVCALINTDYGSAITLAERLYSQYKQPFVTAVLGATALASTDTIEYDFIDTLSEEAGLNTILSHVTNADWKNHLSAKAINPLIDQLQAAVEASKATRGKGPEARRRAGVKLMNDTKPLIKKLKALLPTTDIRYQTIVDKVGTEILQCGIDYYNDSDDPNAAHNAMELQSYASSIVVGPMAKDRCEQNVDILKRIIASLPPAEVMQEVNAIKKQLEYAKERSSTISSAKVLLNNTRQPLLTIKSKLGINNAAYLKISTAVVAVALGNVIAEVNKAQEDAMIDIVINKDFSKIKAVLRNAWEVTKLMDNFDMENEFKTRYNQNHSTLKGLCQQLGISTSTYSGSGSGYGSGGITSGGSTSTTTDSSGCSTAWYIIAVIVAIIIIIQCSSSCSNAPRQTNTSEIEETYEYENDNSYTSNRNGYSRDDASYEKPTGSQQTLTREENVETKTYSRLSTGDKPYSRYYQTTTGNNYIKFITEGNSDYVVIVKNASTDKAVNHVYIRGGSTTSLYVPDGTYDVYFYSGRGGWNPDKVKGSVKGGFAYGETLQKDGPLPLHGQDCEYTLYPVVNGNLTLSPTNEEEAF